MHPRALLHSYPLSASTAPASMPVSRRIAMRAIRWLSSGESETDRPTLGIAHHVYLGAQPCSGAAQSLTLAPPLPEAESVMRPDYDGVDQPQRRLVRGRSAAPGISSARCPIWRHHRVRSDLWSLFQLPNCAGRSFHCPDRMRMNHSTPLPKLRLALATTLHTCPGDRA